MRFIPRHAASKSVKFGSIPYGPLRSQSRVVDTVIDVGGLECIIHNVEFAGSKIPEQDLGVTDQFIKVLPCSKISILREGSSRASTLHTNGTQL